MTGPNTTRPDIGRPNIGLALHGGAGPRRRDAYPAEEQVLSEIGQAARDALMDGAAALDVVQDAVAALEACGLFIAGRGASPNAEGVFELDAAIMDGATRRAGGVGALVGFASPIAVARAVMERTRHVLLVGSGASAFATREGCARIDDPKTFFSPASQTTAGPDDLAHGTVGAVARDRSGGLAAATSTGGVLNKTPGRVGDSPIIGAGTWADERVAVSCTGQGEYFMRSAAAADISARIAYAGMSLDAAAAGALADMARQGGDGGVIGVDARGRACAPFTSQMMARAWLDGAGALQVACL